MKKLVLIALLALTVLALAACQKAADPVETPVTEPSAQGQPGHVRSSDIPRWPRERDCN